MPLNSKSANTPLRSPLFLFIVVGNLLFSIVFVLSMGFHVVKSGNEMQQTVEKTEAPAKEQKVVTLAQIN